MPLWSSLARILDPSRSHYVKTFSLGDRGRQEPEVVSKQLQELGDVKTEAAGLGRRLDRLLSADPMGTATPEEIEDLGDLAEDLQENLDRLRQLFRAPDNKDLIIKEFRVATEPPLQAALVFMEGMADKTIINPYILEPLMLLAQVPADTLDGDDPVQWLKQRLVPGHETAVKPDMKAVIDAILIGDTVIFLDGHSRVITVETKGPPTRSVSEPKTEQVIRGPHDAFNESFRINVSLVRRRVRHPKVVTELLQVGRYSKLIVALMYIDGIANPKLVHEVRRRIQSLTDKIDFVGESGLLEQMIEDSPNSLLPQALATERPDRVAAGLSEGQVAVLADNSPYALVMPISFWSLMETAEDYYLRWPLGVFARLLRYLALFLTLLIPAVYIAATNFHQEMIPTELLLSIAAARERVPFTAITELLVMELAFELIREAGVRVPSVIGPTLSIVGALILGQAAVQARIVSPILVIIVAITGLSSYAIPNYSLAFGVRMLRFILIGLAATLGLYGVAAGITLLVAHVATLKAFGLPMLSPVAPRRRRGLGGAVIRNQVTAREDRPYGPRPTDVQRTDRMLRSWDPMARAEQPGNASETQGKEE